MVFKRELREEAAMYGVYVAKHSSLLAHAARVGPTGHYAKAQTF
jgi:hypothetical protein